MAEENKQSPVFNPADRLDLGGALMHLIKYIRTNMECMVAARVIEYDRNTHIAKVQPLVNSAHPNGDGLTYMEHQTFNVTVLRVCHGGFLFDMPIDVGATGWVIAADRDTTFAKEKNAAIHGKDNEGTQIPNSFLKHQYTQGFFFPDSWATILLDTDERFKDKLVIGDIDDSDEFTAYITISRDGRIVIHGLGIVLDAPVEINGDLLVHGNAEIDGDLNVKGRILNNGEPLKPEGGGWQPPDDLWVIVGIEYDLTPTISENNWIDMTYSATITKCHLKSGEVEVDKVDLFTMHQAEVVTSSEYSNGQFKNSIRKFFVIGPAQNAQTSTIFSTENQEVVVGTDFSNLVFSQTKKSIVVLGTGSNSTSNVFSAGNVDVLVDTSYDTHKLTKTKKSIAVLGISANSQTSDVFTASSVNVVTNTDYTNPDFKQTKRSVHVIEAGSDGTPTTVFTTTPLSSEIGGA